MTSKQTAATASSKMRLYTGCTSRELAFDAARAAKGDRGMVPRQGDGFNGDLECGELFLVNLEVDHAVGPGHGTVNGDVMYADHLIVGLGKVGVACEVVEPQGGARMRIHRDEIILNSISNRMFAHVDHEDPNVQFRLSRLVDPPLRRCLASDYASVRSNEMKSL